MIRLAAGCVSAKCPAALSSAHFKRCPGCAGSKPCPRRGLLVAFRARSLRRSCACCTSGLRFQLTTSSCWPPGSSRSSSTPWQQRGMPSTNPPSWRRCSRRRWTRQPQGLVRTLTRPSPRSRPRRRGRLRARRPRRCRTGRAWATRSRLKASEPETAVKTAQASRCIGTGERQCQVRLFPATPRAHTHTHTHTHTRTHARAHARTREDTHAHTHT